MPGIVAVIIYCLIIVSKTSGRKKYTSDQFLETGETMCREKKGIKSPDARDSPHLNPRNGSAPDVGCKV